MNCVYCMCLNVWVTLKSFGWKLHKLILSLKKKIVKIICSLLSQLYIYLNINSFYIFQ